MSELNDKDRIGAKFQKVIKGLEIGPVFSDEFKNFNVSDAFDDLVEEEFSDEIMELCQEGDNYYERVSNRSIVIDSNKLNRINRIIYVDIDESLFRLGDSSKVLINFNKFGELAKKLLYYLLEVELTHYSRSKELTPSMIDEFLSLFRAVYNTTKNRIGRELIIYIPDVTYWTVSPSSGGVIYSMFQDMFMYADGLIIKANQRNAIIEKISDVTRIKVKQYVLLDKLVKPYLTGLINAIVKYCIDAKENENEQLIESLEIENNIGLFYNSLCEIMPLVEAMVYEAITDGKEGKDGKEDKYDKPLPVISDTTYNAIISTYIDYMIDHNNYPKDLVQFENELKNLNYVAMLLPDDDSIKTKIVETKDKIKSFIPPKQLKFNINSFVRFIFGSNPTLASNSNYSKYLSYLEDKDQDAMDLKNTIENFDRLFGERIIGQEQVIKPLWNVLKRWFIGIRSNKPIGSFLMVGPTGVGKTETAKFLADKTFGNLIVLDMSEYQSEIDKTKIIGVAPGYSGYDQGAGVLDKVAANPRSVILFDEIEKAHPLIFDLLLQLLDEGRLTDHKGNEVSFKECLIICTTNAHYGDIEHLGSNTRAKMIEILSMTFRKEFLSRFNDVLKYKFLNEDVMGLIFDKKVNEELNTIASSSNLSNIRVIEDENYYKVKHDIIGFMDHSLGARELDRVINEKIVAPLIELVIDLGSDIWDKEFYFDTVGVLKYK